MNKEQNISGDKELHYFDLFLICCMHYTVCCTSCTTNRKLYKNPAFT